MFLTSIIITFNNEAKIEKEKRYHIEVKTGFSTI